MGGASGTLATSNIHAPKGQPQTSPGHRPGKAGKPGLNPGLPGWAGHFAYDRLTVDYFKRL
ncbi:hypothetical protein Pan181_11970 [Aeoliella mucimassa]|uniref:Uncharacterized protein n=1 Tax=Aeoliella mucimassa TaxID=2527972 RepID=A0A518AJV7_9BACT|nr:hypothetical protein Pan181_11970 [Aeoliella mucimassa]